MITLFKIQALLLLILSLSCFCLADKNIPCNYYESVNITGAVINDVGSAIFEGQEYLNGSYGYFNDSFFGSVDKSETNKTKTHLRGCFCHLAGKPCVPVCCPAGFIKRKEYGSACYPYKYDVLVNTSNFENYTTIEIADKYRIVQGDPCSSQYHLYEKWELLENGSIHSDELDNDPNFEYGDFCIDPILTDDLKIDTRISMCFKRRENSYLYAKTHFYEILGMIISIVFLLITISIYVFVPELRNLRGKLLMCYIAAIVVFYIFVAIDKSEFLYDSDMSCTLAGFISYGSVLLAIFFLNAISFDYFTAFYLKDYRAENKSKLYRWYVAYSVGGTLLLVFIAAILDSTEIIPEEYRPNIGSGSCFLDIDRVGKFVFLYFFVAVTIFLNTLLLIVTGCKMRRIMKTRTMGKVDRYNYNDLMERETFCHLILLFLFVDIFWAAEVFLWSVRAHRHLSDDPVVRVFQVLGYSQGFWIFVICILRGRTFELIAKNWSRFKANRNGSGEGDIKYLRADSNISAQT